MYGGKASGHDSHKHLKDFIQNLGFTYCLADLDVWMRPAIKSDGLEYYEYGVISTDDELVVSENGDQLLRCGIGNYF